MPSTKKNIFFSIISIIVLLTIVAFAYFWGLKIYNSGITHRLLSWETNDSNQVNIRWEISSSQSSEVFCAVRAQNDQYVDIGYAILVLDVHKNKIIEYSLQTLEKAYVADVLGCANSLDKLFVDSSEFYPGTLPPIQPTPAIANQ